MVRHFNIVQLKKVLQTERNIYIIMEYVSGGELFSRIVKEKQFDENTARKYFQQLILAVSIQFSYYFGSILQY